MRGPPALFALALLLGARGAVTAQVLPLTIPKGTVRFDLSGHFESFDRRWNDGTLEEWASDFERALDGSTLPPLLDAQARLRQITGTANLTLSLGRTEARQLLNVGTLGIGAAIGLTNRVTLFGRVPIVRVKARTRVTLDPTGANTGVNPADPTFGSPGAAQPFFADFGAAIAALAARIAAGDFAADPALAALAQATLDRARMLEMELFDFYLRPETASTFVPVAGSAAASALALTIQDLQNTLASLGVAFASLPPLPTDPMSADQLLGYITNPDGPINAHPFNDVPELQYLGDVELGVAVTLVDRYPEAFYGGGIRTALEGRIRLRTARLDDPDRFLDLGTGDRQPDVELNLVTDLGLGRFGARLLGGYTLQLAGNQNRRVAPPGVIAPEDTRAGVRRDPGDVIRLAVRPYARLAPFFALSAGVDYWRRGRDAYTYVEGQPPVANADIDVLATGTSASAALFSVAVTYTHSGLDRYGRQRKPLDASIQWERVLHSGAGIVPDQHAVRAGIRLYTRFW